MLRLFLSFLCSLRLGLWLVRQNLSRNGVQFWWRFRFVRRITKDRPFTAEELERIPEKHRPTPETLVTRSEIVALDMPKFNTVLNREAVIFDAADPELATS